MAQAYVAPGVSVSELVNPSFQPVAVETTDICLIGVGAGFQAKSDIVQLLDNNAVTLSVDDGIDLSGVIVSDYADSSTVYQQGGNAGSLDYFITGNTIQRSLDTAIRDGETIVIVGEQAEGAHFSELVELDGLGSAAGTDLVTSSSDSGDTINNFQAQRQGIIPTECGTGVSPSGSDGLYIQTDAGPPMTIKVISGSAVSIADTSLQSVWISYVDVDANQVTRMVTLTSTTAVDIGTSDDPQPALDTNGNIVGLAVRNVNDLTKNEPVIRFFTTADSTAPSIPDSGEDLTVNFTNSFLGYVAYRADSPSTIPNGSTVRVSYTATPGDYYQPTRCFSLQDVESKYGAGLAGDNDPDGFASGTIKSPVSFAAQLAFLNGAPSVVIQILYSSAVVAGQTVNFTSLDPGTLSDWTNTLQGLRIIEDVNLLVPIITTNGVDNSLALSIFEEVQNHITYMTQNEFQYLQAILGMDSTSTGATADLIRAAGSALGARSSSQPESLSLISPAAFSIANPVTGLPMAVGGQYIAAALAGSVAASEIQASLTRHAVGGVIDILDPRTESDKDTDAKAGLMVIENRRGVIQVRHGLTVAVNSPNTREFSVIRAKHYMIESVRETLDDQVVGQIVADSRAAFTVQLLVEAVLEGLVGEGAIVTYSGVTAALSNLDPTTITVGFQYLPAFPLNYVQIQFSINTSTNVVTSTDVQS